MKKPTCTLYGGHSPAIRKCARRFFSFMPQGNEKKKTKKKKTTVDSHTLISYHFHTKSKDKQP